MARKVVTQKQRDASRKNLLRGALYGCAALVVLFLLVVGVLAIRLLQKPGPLKEDKLAEKAKQSPQPARNIAPSPPLDQQIQQLQHASEARIRMPVRLVATQDEVNARLAREAAQTPDFTNVSAHFGDGMVAVTADRKWRSFTFHLTVRGKPTVANGEVHVPIIDARAGNVGLPAVARRELEARVNRAVKKQWPGLRVSSVAVEPGLLIAEGETVPQ